MKLMLLAAFALGVGLLIWLLARHVADPAPLGPSVLPPPPGVTGTAPGRTASPPPAPIATQPYEADVPLEDPDTASKAEVRVLQEGTGDPVAGAHVHLYDFTVYSRILTERGVAHGSPASREVSSELGSSALTDGAGLARLPFAGSAVMIEARHGSRWGFAFVRRFPEAPVEILLTEDLVLRVRVVSEQGTAAPGIPIALRLRVSDEPRFTSKLTETEPPDGIGIFEHLQRRFAQGAGWHVTFAFPLADPPAVLVFENDLPRDPVELTLPATGALEVIVRDDQDRPVGGDRLALKIETFSDSGSGQLLWPGGPWSEPRLDLEGVSRVPMVGLGLTIRVTATPRDADSERRPVTADVTGPRRPGEVVTCSLRVETELEPAERFPTVAGRFVRQDGKPWGATTVIAQTRLFPYDPNLRKITIEVTTDGRFRFLAKKPCPAGGTRKYRFTADHGNEHVIGWLDLSRDLPPGFTDVGDVVLDHGVLLVSGRVVDETGAPVARARLTVSALVPKGGTDYWPHVDVAGTTMTPEDGSFTVHAVAGSALPTPALRLFAQCRGFPTGSPVEFGIGKRDLRYELRRGGAIAGSFRLAPGQDGGAFRVSLRGGDLFRILDVKPDGSFGGDELPAGLVELMATLASAGAGSQGDATLQVENIEVIPGITNRDPRIQDISLGGETHKLVLQIVDESGTPLNRASVEVLGNDGLATYSDSAGKAIVRSGSLPIDIQVTAFGYRREYLGGVRADKRITLRKGLPILLTTNARPYGRNPPYRLGVLVTRFEEGSFMPEWIFYRIRPSGGTFFDERSELRLNLPLPGVYELQPHVVVIGPVASGGGIGMQPLPRITVLDTPDLQSFRLDLPLDKLETALRNYEK